MKQDIIINELIESFLNGKLSPEEVEIVTNRIKNEPDFAKQVNSIKAAHEIISDSALLDIKNELKNIHTSRLNWNNRIKWITGGGIGILTITLIFYFLWHSVNNSKNNVQNINKLENVVTPLEKSEIKNSEISNKKDTYIIINKPVTNELNRENQIVNPITPASDSANTSKKEVVHNEQNKADEKANSTNLPVNNSKANEAVNCSKVKITAEWQVKESCNTKPTGVIVLFEGSISGGQTPYSYSINKKDFTDSAVFRNLFSGTYKVYVKDANHCIKLTSTLYIETINCNPTYAAVFAPLKGETWTIPVKEGMEGNIRIFSKNGNLVFQTNLNNTENNWNGSDMAGNPLPMGIYQFFIQYTNKDVLNGTVTILK